MLRQLAKNLWVVAPPVKPRFPYGNCLYIEGAEPIVIDAGAGVNAFAEIAADQVHWVLLSHSHFDHVHSSACFKQARILAGWQEENCYKDEKAYADFNGYSNWHKLMPGIERENFTTIFPPPEDVPLAPGFQIIPLAGTFSDMDCWDSGTIKVRALHLPGHTSGHYGFFIEREGVLFSADLDLVAAGPWLGSNSADIDDLICSVERIKQLNPRIIVPSHRREQDSNLARQLDTFIGVVLKRQEHILNLLKIPHSIEQLAAYRMVYPHPTTMHEVFWERMTMFNHLRFSLRHGLAAEVCPGLFQRV